MDQDNLTTIKEAISKEAEDTTQEEEEEDLTLEDRIMNLAGEVETIIGTRRKGTNKKKIILLHEDPHDSLGSKLQRSNKTLIQKVNQIKNRL